MIVLGCDPDLHNTAFALVEDDHPPRVWHVEIASIPRKLKREDACLAMSGVVSYALANLMECVLGTQDGNGVEIGLATEGQHLHLGGSARKMTPEDLANLAFVAGAAHHAAQREISQRGYRLGWQHRPSAQTWKGSIDKPTHQAQLCVQLGWAYDKLSDHSRPIPGATNIALDPVSNWRHAMDAIGLAMWGLKTWAFDKRRAALRKS